jgi:hypothetical protein
MNAPDLARSLEDRGIRLKKHQPGEHGHPVRSATAARRTLRSRSASMTTARHGYAIGASGREASGLSGSNFRAAAKNRSPATGNQNVQILSRPILYRPLSATSCGATDRLTGDHHHSQTLIPSSPRRSGPMRSA